MDCANEGFSLKLRIRKNHLTYDWLLAELKEAGINITKDYLSKCINGKLKAEDAQILIDASNKILTEYEQFIKTI